MAWIAKPSEEDDEESQPNMFTQINSLKKKRVATNWCASLNHYWGGASDSDR